MPNGIDGVGTEGSYNLSQSDTKMSESHMKDTLEYNLRHAEEHLKSAKETCERLQASNIHFDIPKSLLDLADYFEQKSTDHSESDHSDMKLKQHIARNYK